MIAPDGKHIAVTVINGSSRPKNSPFFNDYGLVGIFAVNGSKLSKVTEAKTGHWCQGAAWSKDSKVLLMQCMVEQEIQVFSFDGTALKQTGAIKVTGGPAGIGSAQ
jgi:hypothetical protein